MKSTRIRSSHDVDIRHGCWLELNFIFRHAEVSAEQGEVLRYLEHHHNVCRYPNPVIGHDGGCRREACARTYQTTPIGSCIKVIVSPTDRLREQTKSGQLKAQVHQRLHRPKWHTTEQLKCRGVRPPDPIPTRPRESALTRNCDQRRPARRCAMRSSRWHTETAARTS